MLTEDRFEVADRGHFGVVNGDHAVSDLKACLFRVGTGFDGGDIQAAVGHVEIILREHRVAFAERHAGGRLAAHIAVLLQVAENIQRVVDGDDKADVVDGGVRGLCHHDACQLALTVEHAAAGVAGVDSGVCLHQVHGLAVDLKGAVNRRDDALGHGAAQRAQRIADDDGLVTRLDLGGIADRGRRKTACFDFYKSDVHIRVGTDQLRLIAVARAKGDGDV